MNRRLKHLNWPLIKAFTGLFIAISVVIAGYYFLTSHSLDIEQASLQDWVLLIWIIIGTIAVLLLNFDFRRRY